MASLLAAGSLLRILVPGELRDFFAEVRASRPMVAIDIAQEFFSSDRVWMFIAASRELLGTHLALNLQLTGKALLVKDSVLIIENRHRAASVFDANVGRPAQDPA